MKRFLLFSIVLAVLIAECIPVVAQKPKNFTVVIEDLTTRLENAHMSAQPLRLAIVPFGNTQSQTSNRFGDYITESIIGKLNPGKYKIFERKRLDAILREDELMLSDLMLPEAAQKIGKLVPIDALFSGTYTRLKTYIDVSARLIDVTSGEILVSFSGRIKMTKNLKILFPANEPPAPDNSTTISLKPQVKAQPEVEKKSTEEVCRERAKEFEVRLNDLSTSEKINSVAKEAMKVPFIGKCGEIHFDVMYYFTRYKIRQPEYESFLLSTLDSIALPTLDDRAYSIFKFMERDSTIEAREWKIGINTVAKVGNYTHSSYLGYLIGRTNSSDAELQERIDTYFALAANHKIGLPVAISANDAFFAMFTGMSFKPHWQVYVFEKYRSTVTLDTRSASKYFTELQYLYKAEDRPQVKTKILGWLIDFFNTHVDEKSPEHLFDFALSSQPTNDDDRNKRKLTEFPKADLILLIDRCRDKFSEYAMKSPYKSQQTDYINFCIKYGIPVAGVIPSIAEADVILKGSDREKQLEVMKMLIQMGDRPKQLESTIIALLSKRDLDDKETMTEIQVLAIKTLGNMKTSQPAAISYMISKLGSFNYDESDNSATALAQIGRPSVTPLINRLNSTNNQDGGLRYKIVVILGKIGPSAKPAESSLKKLLAETSNSDIKYAVEAALERIN